MSLAPAAVSAVLAAFLIAHPLRAEGPVDFDAKLKHAISASEEAKSESGKAMLAALNAKDAEKVRSLLAEASGDAPPTFFQLVVEGLSALTLGKSDPAIDAFEVALVFAPSDAVARLLYCRIALLLDEASRGPRPEVLKRVAPFAEACLAHGAPSTEMVVLGARLKPHLTLMEVSQDALAQRLALLDTHLQDTPDPILDGIRARAHARLIHLTHLQGQAELAQGQEEHLLKTHGHMAEIVCQLAFNAQNRYFEDPRRHGGDWSRAVRLLSRCGEMDPDSDVADSLLRLFIQRFLRPVLLSFSGLLLGLALFLRHRRRRGL
jgi:hypothetical protein